jgi:hypothetical protein
MLMPITRPNNPGASRGSLIQTVKSAGQRRNLARCLMFEILPYRQMSNLSITRAVAFHSPRGMWLVKGPTKCQKPSEAGSSVKRCEKTNCIVNLIKECINYTHPLYYTKDQPKLTVDLRIALFIRRENLYLPHVGRNFLANCWKL